MRPHFASVLALSVVAILLAGTLRGAALAGPVARAASSASEPRMPEILFVENVGQFAPGARFQMRAAQGAMWLTDDGLWLGLAEPGTRDDLPWPGAVQPGAMRTGVHLKLSFPGARAAAQPEPFGRLTVQLSYFRGDDPAGWHSAVPVWSGVRYRDLYPGIDLVLDAAAAAQPRLEARAGADLSAVRLRVDGAERLALDGDVLVVETKVGRYLLPLLNLRATGGTAGALPAGRPALHGLEVVAPFAEAPAGRSLHDGGPASLIYSSFLGGSWDDGGQGIAVDGNGNLYVAGLTGSPDFPVTPGAYQGTLDGNSDVFVSKLSADGTTLLFSTFLGGSYTDFANDLAVDAGGEVYVTGYTASSDFPATPGALDPTYGGGTCGSYPYLYPCPDAFVAKLSADGSALTYATYLGGGGEDIGWQILPGAGGSALVAGEAASLYFPTTPGAYQTLPAGSSDVFATRLSGDGSALVFSTLLGGQGAETGYGLALGSDDTIYLTGPSASVDFPTTPGAFQTTDPGGGVYAGFVARMTPDASGLVYSTYLAAAEGDNSDRPRGVAVDNSGAAYVVGDTASDNFPTTTGAYQTALAGSYDAFVTRLLPDGSGLIYSTYLGAGHIDYGSGGIAVDPYGAAYVAGLTWSSNFPATANAAQPVFQGGYYDAYVAKLDPLGSGLLYSTFLGGSAEEHVAGLAATGSGRVYVTGFNYSADFLTTPDAYQPACGGNCNSTTDAFITILDTGLTAPWRGLFPLIAR